MPYETDFANARKSTKLLNRVSVAAYRVGIEILIADGAVEPVDAARVPRRVAMAKDMVRGASDALDVFVRGMVYMRHATIQDSNLDTAVAALAPTLEHLWEVTP